MIDNKRYVLKKSEVAAAGSLAAAVENVLEEHTLRWYVAAANDDELVIEATLSDEARQQPHESVVGRYYPGKSVVVNVVPTGFGCELGGYAGDAAPVTGLLASTADYLVTNPNAVNASNFIRMDDNVLYTEGSCLDLFCQGAVDLHVPYANRVGLIVEKTTDRELDMVFNVVNAARSVHGVDIVDCVITEDVVGSRCRRSDCGAFVGTVDNPHVIMRSCEQLVARGANAIAITTNIRDLPLDDYAKHFVGEEPNPLGGVEAIISHLITTQFRIPAAHAPLTNMKQLDLEENVVDARGAGEFASPSGLACVLIGLRRAPQFAASATKRSADIVNVNNVLAVVMPAGALGGAPAIYAQKFGIPVVAVWQNGTILDVTARRLGLDNVVEVGNYAEAAGVVLALKKGLSLESIARPLRTLRYGADGMPAEGFAAGVKEPRPPARHAPANEAGD